MKKKNRTFYPLVVRNHCGYLLRRVSRLSIIPKPGAWVINQLFAGEVEIKDSASYDKALPNVQLQENQTYPSSRKKNTFDLYYPQTSKQAVPVVLWVHGGGYVGGDKSGMKEFATRLVADSSVAFISMNYELAPDAPYPSQLQQVNELVQFLLEKKQAYPMLDLSAFYWRGQCGCTDCSTICNSSNQCQLCQRTRDDCSIAG